jgi:hypothetical protein
MDNNKNQEILTRIEKAISEVKNKESVLYFFVADARNVPNAKMEYVYELAYTLQRKKYNVCMLYQLENEYTEKELADLIRKEKPIDERRRFIGVSEWLGERYGNMKHLNISNGTWQVSPSDFLFIPEAFAGLMKETYEKRIPCKRYAIVQNFRHITEFIPFGDQWATYGITDAIVTNQKQSDLVKSVFKYVNTYIIPPYVPEYFRKPLTAKKLIVNILTKTKEDAEHIVKMFYWKYYPFRFVPFRFLTNFPREKYAEMLKEGAITVWVDADSSFGNNAIESIRCGNIVIGKIPETIPEWMLDEKGELTSNGLWTDDINTIPDILASVVNEWIEDNVSPILYDEMSKTDQKYTLDEWNNNIENMITDIFDKRISEFESVKVMTENKIKENNK